ncbi:MAG: S8 family serine peptidase, partial [Chitinophagaceae bacterium]|nr:S8 family serine peptidase [Chitinophagaceae bacterium]
MQIRLLIIFLSLQMVLPSCRKNDSASSTIQGDDCNTVTGLNHGNIIPDQFIVAYRENQSGSLTLARSQGDAMQILKKYRLTETSLVQFISGRNPGMVVKANSEQLQLLRADPTIESVESDRIVSLSTCFTIVSPRLITWNIQRVGYGDGRGKTAWIIDSGVDLDHPDLNVDLARSRSFLSGQSSPEDMNGHGTHVAGIIAAKNNNIGILGIASEANIIALKVLDNDGEGTLSAIQAALGYIEQNAVPGDVVNISLGLEGISDFLDQRVIRMANRGILFSIAAGNESKSAINYSPARANGPNIFTVSAVDSLNRFASFSNFGNDVIDYAAPGVRILSSFTDGRYAIMSGTSMAAPHVAGLLLLNGNKLNSAQTAKNDPDGVADPIV